MKEPFTDREYHQFIAETDLFIQNKHQRPSKCWDMYFCGGIILVTWTALFLYELLSAGFKSPIDPILALGWILVGMGLVSRGILIHRRWAIEYKAAVNEIVERRLLEDQTTKAQPQDDRGEST
jgi:hypothetical protein